MAGDEARKVNGVVFYFVGDKKLFKDFKWGSDRISFAFKNDLSYCGENDAFN